MYFVDLMQKTNMNADRKEIKATSLGGIARFSIFQKYNSFVKQG